MTVEERKEWIEARKQHDQRLFKATNWTLTGREVLESAIIKVARFSIDLLFDLQPATVEEYDRAVIFLQNQETYLMISNNSMSNTVYHTIGGTAMAINYGGTYVVHRKFTNEVFKASMEEYKDAL